MNGLEERYGDQIEFYHLDIDQDITTDVLREYGITGRHQYALFSPEGELIEKWFGSISEAELEAALNTYVSGQQ